MATAVRNTIHLDGAFSRRMAVSIMGADRAVPAKLTLASITSLSLAIKENTRAAKAKKMIPIRVLVSVLSLMAMSERNSDPIAKICESLVDSAAAISPIMAAAAMNPMP